MPVPRPHASSHRDPDARVVDTGTAVLRLLSERGRRDWEHLAATRLFREATDDGRLVPTSELDRSAWPTDLGPEVAAVLEHERLPVVSEPCEWSFAMVQAAALAHLDLLVAATHEGLTTKDGSAANLAFVGHRPVFIDVGSFEVADRGEVWPGYRQACATFLYPLLVEARRGLPAHRLLRAHPDGISPAEASGLLRGAARLRPPALTHVALHARAERSLGERDVSGGARRAQVPPEVTRSTARRLRRAVERLSPPGGRTTWSEYGPRAHYAGADLEAKERFVREAVDRVQPGLVLDLGANDGRFSRLAADAAPVRSVVAVDADVGAVDRLYHDLVARPPARPVLPLVVDLLDPTPARGWRNRERPAFFDRVQPDLVLALAVVHHLTIAGNVPLALVVDLLADLAPDVVVELPTRDDAMVQRLLGRKRPGQHDDYGLATFEALAAERFDVAARHELSTRALFHLHRRDPG